MLFVKSELSSEAVKCTATPASVSAAATKLKINGIAVVKKAFDRLSWRQRERDRFKMDGNSIFLEGKFT